ncbi:unnamed protein product [Haemonchus placei]|uniref:Secreted protein n=1 Tax=Haemonchus placei TaxID=6290 RepID=A0A0N4WAT4_HAEPC|nr:unnamed protein product [Haemonchus placei]
MTWVPPVFILCLVIETSSVILRFQGVAPSLTLDRIHTLRDSIEKLQHINEKVRCRIKGATVVFLLLFLLFVNYSCVWL